MGQEKAKAGGKGAGKGKGWEQLCRWRVRLRLGDVLRSIHPGEEFITYRANGAEQSNGKGKKKIRTWIDHCFASNLLIQNKIIQNVGVYDG